MLAGDFYKKLKKLNRHFVIICNENPKFPAGLYYQTDWEQVHICGVDRNYLPEYTQWSGRFIEKGGWRRVLKLLLGKGLVDRRSVYKVFGVDMSYGHRPASHRWEDPIEKALKEARAIAKEKAQRKSKTELADTQNGRPVHYFELDDLLQIHKMREQAKGK
jgi:hypothetical protein